MSCSCSTKPIQVSTLSEGAYRIAIDSDFDPSSATVEFAWPAFDDDPSTWSAGSWVDDNSDSTTDKGPGGDGLYGWLAQTPSIGPLTDGLYALYVRLTLGAVVHVELVGYLDAS